MALVYFALAWAAGLVAAGQLPNILPTAWLLLGIGGIGGWFFTRGMPRWRLGFALIFAFGCAASRMAVQPTTSALAHYNGRDGITIEGFVITPPQASDISLQTRIAVDTAAVTGADFVVDGLVLAQLPPLSDVRYGDRIRVTGRIREPAAGDAFDYATYLARRGVFSLIDRVAGVTKISGGHGSPLIMVASDLRDFTRSAISRYLPEPHAGILTAILTGDERGISSATAAAYNASGIAHLLAVSGFNMVIVSALALRFLERAERHRWFWLLLGCAMLGGYTLLVGFEPSATRAAVMAVILLVGSAIRRRAYLPASLAFALVTLTFFDPNMLFDLGFQLSFGAVLGIALFARPLTNLFAGLLKPEIPHPLPRAAAALLLEGLVITIAASSLTLPLISLTFGHVPLISFFTNMLVVPVQPLIMFAGAALVFFSPIPAIAQILAWVCLVPLAWTTASAQTLADIPINLSVSLSPLTAALIFGAAITASVGQATRPAWWRWLRKRPVRAAAYASLLCASIIAIATLNARPDGQLHVWFLDVGHTHAVLIQTPSGAQALIDGGRFPSRLLTAIGERLPFNDNTIDAIFVTQPDPFDIAALPAVLRRYDVGMIYTNGQPNLNPELAEIAALGAITPLYAGQRLDTGDGVLIEVLHPQTPPTLENNLDDVALVLRIIYKDVSFLLMGDASTTTQRVMADAGMLTPASVFVLPQHGGRLDSTLLDIVQPSAIVLQSDRANLLGHPNVDVMASLPPETPLYRTDTQGVLHFISDGETLYIETEK